VLDQIEAEQRQQADAIPDNIPIPELAEQVVRGKVKLSQPQLRMLIELLPFHMPKLTAVALGRLTGDDFATRLDRAVEQSEKARRFTRLIELTVAKVVDPESE
jgi:hypothetical protein